MTDARAQDANAVSVAELQQRVQDLEATVRQLKDGRDLTPAATQPVSVAYNDPAAPAVPSAATLANVGTDPTDPPPATNANFIGWKNGFFLESPDKTCSLRITGQIQADYRGFLDPVDSSSTANSAVAGSPTTGSPDIVPHPPRTTWY